MTSVLDEAEPTLPEEGIHELQFHGCNHVMSCHQILFLKKDKILIVKDELFVSGLVIFKHFSFFLVFRFTALIVDAREMG